MTHKRSSFLVLLMCIFGALCASAATYTVKVGGGGNYTTLQACINAMAAGDTCMVYAGTYNETVTISAGAAGNYKTLKVNPGDTVNINGAVSVNSHTKLVGFRISHASSPASGPCVSVAGNATDWFITNNIMQSCGSPMIKESRNFAGTSYGYIQGNTLSYACSTPASPNTCTGMLINGDHHLVENNDISHVSDGITNFGMYNVFRNNVMHDTYTSECGSNSGNCHIDFIESEPVADGSDRPSAYNLYEANFITKNIGGNAHVFLAQGDACNSQCRNLIIRFNHAYQVDQVWLLNDLGLYTHVKNYNNTEVSVNGANGSDFWAGGNVGGAALNNIYYNNCPSCSTISPYAAWDGAEANFVSGHNLIYYPSGGPTLIPPISTDAGSVKGQNPKFVNPSSDWHLQADSPALGAGTALTTITGTSGSGSSITVADADYFQDGLGLTAVGVQPDWIRIGASTTVQIASINYSTRVITLARPISWTTGSLVYLYKDSAGKTVLSSSAPDLGAFPSGGNNTPLGPPPPTNLVLVVQ